MSRASSRVGPHAARQPEREWGGVGELVPYQPWRSRVGQSRLGEKFIFRHFLRRCLLFWQIGTIATRFTHTDVGIHVRQLQTVEDSKSEHCLYTFWGCSCQVLSICILYFRCFFFQHTALSLWIYFVCTWKKGISFLSMPSKKSFDVWKAKNKMWPGGPSKMFQKAFPFKGCFVYSVALLRTFRIKDNCWIGMTATTLSNCCFLFRLTLFSSSSVGMQVPHLPVSSLRSTLLWLRRLQELEGIKINKCLITSKAWRW